MRVLLLVALADTDTEALSWVFFCSPSGVATTLGLLLALVWRLDALEDAALDLDVFKEEERAEVEVNTDEIAS